MKQTLTSTSRSSGSAQTRAYSAKDVRFENALKDFHVDFRESDEASVSDVARVLRILGKGRDSPEPDLNSFHEIRHVVTAENEVSITNRLTPLLMPHRDLPSNNAKTKNIFYRQDTTWYN